MGKTAKWQKSFPFITGQKFKNSTYQRGHSKNTPQPWNSNPSVSVNRNTDNSAKQGQRNERTPQKRTRNSDRYNDGRNENEGDQSRERHSSNASISSLETAASNERGRRRPRGRSNDRRSHMVSNESSPNGQRSRQSRESTSSHDSQQRHKGRIKVICTQKCMK